MTRSPSHVSATPEFTSTRSIKSLTPPPNGKRSRSPSPRNTREDTPEPAEEQEVIPQPYEPPIRTVMPELIREEKKKLSSIILFHGGKSKMSFSVDREIGWSVIKRLQSLSWKTTIRWASRSCYLSCQVGDFVLLNSILIEQYPHQVHDQTEEYEVRAVVEGVSNTISRKVTEKIWVEKLGMQVEMETEKWRGYEVGPEHSDTVIRVGLNTLFATWNELYSGRRRAAGASITAPW